MFPSHEILVANYAFPSWPFFWQNSLEADEIYNSSDKACANLRLRCTAAFNLLKNNELDQHRICRLEIFEGRKNVDRRDDVPELYKQLMIDVECRARMIWQFFTSCGSALIARAAKHGCKFCIFSPNKPQEIHSQRRKGKSMLSIEKKDQLETFKQAIDFKGIINKT